MSRKVRFYNKNNYEYDSNIQPGDVRLNGYTLHPCYVLDNPIEVFRVIGLTSNISTNGKKNIPLKNGKYANSFIDFLSKDKLYDKYKNYNINEDDKKMLDSIGNNKKSKYIGSVVTQKIK